MPVNLRGKSFLTLKDFSPKEIHFLLDLSKDLKSKSRAGIRGTLLEGKNVVLIFDKPSTRTRCAFEMGAAQEGAYVTFLSNSQMGKKESIEDTGEVLGRYYDGIEYRGFKQSLVEELAEHSGVPVWNGLTDDYHPTQILADLLTIREKIFKPFENIKVVLNWDYFETLLCSAQQPKTENPDRELRWKLEKLKSAAKIVIKKLKQLEISDREYQWKIEQLITQSNNVIKILK